MQAFDLAKKYPYHHKTDDAELVSEWQKRQNKVALRDLILKNQRLVAKIARGYSGYGLPLSDLIAEGNIGMMNAIKNFDISKGFKLSTYAVWWIKAAINDFVLGAYSLVKVARSSNQRRLFFKLKRAESDLAENGQISEFLTHEMAEKIAKKLNVSVNDVIQMHGRLLKDVSLNVPLSNDETGTEWMDFIPDAHANIDIQAIENDENERRHKIIEDALTILTPREKDIVKRRRLLEPPESLETVSNIYDISRERVRQIETRAMDKIKEHILQASERGYHFV